MKTMNPSYENVGIPEPAGVNEALEKQRNPHDVCTWQENPGCSKCECKGKLKCRMSYLDWAHFMVTYLCYFLPAALGMILGGYLTALLISIGLFGVLFFWAVPGFLCRHCPFYAEEGIFLRCPAHYGSLKLWKYKPGPLNAFERALVFICFGLIFGTPIPFLVLSGEWAFLALSLLGTILFFFTMLKYICATCVNFSCPMNTVPPEIVEAYYQKNPQIAPRS